MTDIVSRSTDVAEIAAKHANDMEISRRLHSEAVEAVVAAGFARHFVPTAHAGRGGDFTSFLAAVTVVGRSCASTAWFASLTAGLGRMAGYLPGPARAELWAGGPDTVIVGALMPLGTAEPAAGGGWTVRGRWPYVSGIDHSDWALVCAMATSPAGPPEARFFLIPRPVYGIVDTWFNVGMRATGSNTLVLDETFVPATHTFSREELTAGRAGPQAVSVADATPLRAINGMSFAAPILGAAQGAMQSWTRTLTEKKQQNVEHLHLVLARSSGEIDAAGLLLARSAGVADRGDVTPEETTQAWRDSTVAADLLVTAVNRLMTSAGTSVQVDTHPLQRYWRDVNAAATHVVLRPEGAASAFSLGILKPLAGNS